MWSSVHAYMLERALFGIDPQKKINFARSTQHLLLHLAWQCKNGFAIRRGQSRYRRVEIAPRDAGVSSTHLTRPIRLSPSPVSVTRWL